MAQRFASPLPFSFNVVGAPQLGSTTRIDGMTFNSAEVQSAVARGGHVWVAHQVGLPSTTPTRTSLQWWELDPGGSGIVAVGRVDDPLGVRMYSHPALAVNKVGDVLLGFSRFGADVYASAGFAVHLANDPAGVMRDEVIYKDGEGVYTRVSGTTVRWGDYSPPPSTRSTTAAPGPSRNTPRRRTPGAPGGPRCPCQTSRWSFVRRPSPPRAKT